jgi:hypothetical protein
MRTNPAGDYYEEKIHSILQKFTKNDALETNPSMKN